MQMMCSVAAATARTDRCFFRPAFFSPRTTWSGGSSPPPDALQALQSQPMPTAKQQRRKSALTDDRCTSLLTPADRYTQQLLVDARTDALASTESPARGSGQLSGQSLVSAPRLVRER